MVAIYLTHLKLLEIYHLPVSEENTKEKLMAKKVKRSL
jgi:hypothetical protein